MAISGAFGLMGSTYFVGASAVQIPSPGTPLNCAMRIRNLSGSVQYFAWGNSSVSAPVAPTQGSPSANTVGMVGGSVEVFMLPPGAWLIASSATGFEVTAGEGV